MWLVWTFAASGADDRFLREVADVPRPRGEDRADITYVVQRHIPAGSSLDDAVAYLEHRGFKVYPGRQVPLGHKSLIATRYERYYVIFAEETRVILEFDGSQVVRARGWLFLKGI